MASMSVLAITSQQHAISYAPFDEQYRSPLCKRRECHVIAFGKWPGGLVAAPAHVRSGGRGVDLGGSGGGDVTCPGGRLGGISPRRPGLPHRDARRAGGGREGRGLQ